MERASLFIEEKGIVAGGNQLTFDIPNDFAIGRALLRARGSIAVGTANADGLHYLGSANILENLRIQAKGAQRMDISGRSLYIMGQMLNQQTLPKTDPGLTQATHPIGCTFVRDFQLMKMLIPWNHRGALPAHLIRDVRLIATVAPESAVLNGAATTTLTYGAAGTSFLSLQVDQLPLASKDINDYVNEQVIDFAVDAQILTSAGANKSIRLNTGGLYRFVGMIVEVQDANGTYVGRNDVITNVRIVANRTDRERARWLELQDANALQFLWPTTQLGFAAFDWTAFAEPNELFNADEMVLGGSDLRLVFDVSPSLTTACRLTVFTSRLFGDIVPVAA